ncbi:hypothetical protein MHC_03565 [Mycoplasma haemocanis str. Illinois]|uniref:Uncharacterized protein n=1 Tax=Mycoplasma haemocanis (strain Illinois) TaxID=1111676 RepID=H6N7F1_MYCHN|nr:hypothetical protein [Mycoplasma haemocanis]AEW45573.1 hypothetical protein MHC_03565 [Mycoplasma haemocanis str. Illinois]
MEVFSKIVLGAGTAAGISGVGYLSFSHLNKEKTTSIKELILKDPSIALINSNEEARWSKIWTEYAKQNANKAKDSWSLEGWDHTKTQTRLPSLSAKCSSELLREVKSTEDKEYKDFVTWCTREAEFQDKLAREGYRPISEKDQESTWTNNFNEYKKADNKLKIHDLTIGEQEQQSDKLKEGCKTALAKPISDSNYAATFEGIKRWCAVK